jgi:L-serine deaminase
VVVSGAVVPGQRADALRAGSTAEALREDLSAADARSRDTMAWINMQATLAIIPWTLMMAGTLMRR